VGCWAHARRKYDEALKAAPPSIRGNKDSVASQGLAYCNALFTIEREMKDVSAKERYDERKKRSLPILEAYSVWLKQQLSQTLPKSLVGKAITYSLNQWEKLTAFLKDGRFEIDNNRSERSIKPFYLPWSSSLPITCRVIG
jgi:transposase